MASARRIRLIVNPSARSGRGVRALRRMRLLDPRTNGVELESLESRSAEHLCELVRQAQDADLDALALAGGDGTVTLALRALPSRNALPIGLLPTGSGNDFARHVGVPDRLAPAFAVLLHGRPRWVDLVRVQPGDARYCCVASVGLDELALQMIHGSRWDPLESTCRHASLSIL